MLREGRDVSRGGGADQRKLIFILEQRNGAGLEMPARHLGGAGLPEYRGRKNAGGKRDEPIGNAIHRGDRPPDHPCRSGFGKRRNGNSSGHGCSLFRGSGTTMSRNRPEPIRPARLPVRSKSGSSARAASAASPSGRPAASASRNAAPPGGSARTSTSRRGRATSASSPRQSSTGA